MMHSGSQREPSPSADRGPRKALSLVAAALVVLGAAAACRATPSPAAPIGSQGEEPRVARGDPDYAGAGDATDAESPPALAGEPLQYHPYWTTIQAAQQSVPFDEPTWLPEGFALDESQVSLSISDGLPFSVSLYWADESQGGDSITLQVFSSAEFMWPQGLVVTETVKIGEREAVWVEPPLGEDQAVGEVSSSFPAWLWWRQGEQEYALMGGSPAVEEETVLRVASSFPYFTGADDYTGDWLDVTDHTAFPGAAEVQPLGLFVRDAEGGLEVVAVAQFGPSDARLSPGDLITAIDGEDAAGLEPGEAIQLLYGSEGARVQMEVQDAEGAVRDVEVLRSLGWLGGAAAAGSVRSPTVVEPNFSDQREASAPEELAAAGVDGRLVHVRFGSAQDAVYEIDVASGDSRVLWELPQGFEMHRGVVSDDGEYLTGLIAERTRTEDFTTQVVMAIYARRLNLTADRETLAVADDYFIKGIAFPRSAAPEAAFPYGSALLYGSLNDPVGFEVMQSQPHPTAGMAVMEISPDAVFSLRMVEPVDPDLARKEPVTERSVWEVQLEKLTSSEGDLELTCWDPQANRAALMLQTTKGVRSAPDGAIRAVLLLVDLSSGEEVMREEIDTLDTVCSPDGRWLAHGSRSGVRILELATGEIREVPVDPEYANPRNIVWSPDSALLAWSEDGMQAGITNSRVWPLDETREGDVAWQVVGRVSAVAFDHASELLLAEHRSLGDARWMEVYPLTGESPLALSWMVEGTGELYWLPR